jgi:hypothetical protein
MGEADQPALSAEQKAILKGDPLAGLGAYQAVMEYEWWRPLRQNDQLKVMSRPPSAQLAVHLNCVYDQSLRAQHRLLL